MVYHGSFNLERNKISSDAYKMLIPYLEVSPAMETLLSPYFSRGGNFVIIRVINAYLIPILLPYHQLIFLVSISQNRPAECI